MNARSKVFLTVTVTLILAHRFLNAFQNDSGQTVTGNRWETFFPAIVKILDNDRVPIGSGFVVGTDGNAIFIVTAEHVATVPVAYVQFRGFEAMAANVV